MSMIYLLVIKVKKNAPFVWGVFTAICVLIHWGLLPLAAIP